MTKQFSPSCEKNKEAIIEQLYHCFESSQRVLEIGSGSGQHAVFFAPRLPHLSWQTSDMPENHASINAWIAESEAENIHAPLEFTVGVNDWPALDVDAVFTANTTHIMQPDEARQMMEMISDNLPVGGIFCQYGPMKVNGNYTSDSNLAFDESLKRQGFGGYVDIGQLVIWAQKLELVDTIPMPANNFLLVWRK